ncbi:protein kinase [Microbulbifer sp. SAOS-129_SWC]|uniref:protein kinase domain-containing protein n=1 Tax=Microbulbifer sp. SAOS-129_SWC TaxID=3145235 RepID=UPI003217FDEA
MDFAQPEQILSDRYRIERTLGAGGMGVVYLAEDLKLQRRVAIKKLRTDTANESASVRIQSEARLLAQLNHPHVVQLYDAIDTRDGIALVMEYVEGTALSTRQQSQPLSLAAKLDLLVQICRGIDAAHRLGIVHRDLKPDNILVAADGSAKVADFGIASSIEPGDERLTRDGKVAGSFDTMAPEQLRGEAPQPHSDLFALGLLAYRLLCGQHPFGDNRSPYTTAERILRKPHPPATRFNPELPPALNRLLDRLLAKEPAERPPGAAAVAAELERIGRDLAEGGERRSEIPPAHNPPTSEEHYRRRRLPFGALAALLLVVAAAAVGVSLSLRHPGFAHWDSGRYIAVLMPAEIPKQNSAQIQSALGAICRALANRRGLYLVPYSESAALRGQPASAQAQKLNAQLLLKPRFDCGASDCKLTMALIDASDLRTIGKRSLSLKPHAIRRGYERTQQQLNYLLGDYPPRGRDPDLSIGEAEYQRFLALETHSFYYRNIEVFASTMQALEALQPQAPDYPPIYLLYTQLAFDDRTINRNIDAVERLQRFLARAPDDIGDTFALLMSHYYLALLQYDWNRARELLARLKDVAPDPASYYFTEASYYQLRDDYPAALHSIDRALALRTSVTYLMQKATILSYAGQLPAAQPILEQVLALDKKDFAATSLLAANDLDMGALQAAIELLEHADPQQLSSIDIFNLCQARYLQGELAQSDRCFADLYRRLPDDLEPLLYRAEIARLRGQPRRAQQFAEKVRDLGRTRKGWENRLILARAYALLGQQEEAASALMEIRRQATDDTYVNNAMAQAYIATDDHASAAATIRRALELGQSPVWYRTPRFASLCRHRAFAGLRADYPALCAKAQADGEIVAGAGTG